MKFNLTLILVCLPFADLKAQQETTVISGTVTDSLGRPVPFAAIALVDRSGGTYSDINGQFILKTVHFPVSLAIMNVGYEKKELTIEEPSSRDISIVLHEKVTMLKEVVVTDTKTKVKPKMIGSPKSRKGILTFGVSKPFEQIGLMVKNENNRLYANPAWLAVWVRIDGGGIFDFGSKPTGERQLRLRIYSISDEGGVGEDILTSNVFLSPHKVGWYKVDVSHLDLALPPEGFVAAVEWLDNQPVRQWEFKNDDDIVVFYGVDLLGHRLREEEKKYYSTFRFRSLATGWQRPEHIAEREQYIPCIRLEFIELDDLR